MEPKSLLLSLQVPANGSYPKPEKLQIYMHGRYLYRHIHIQMAFGNDLDRGCCFRK